MAMPVFSGGSDCPRSGLGMTHGHWPQISRGGPGMQRAGWGCVTWGPRLGPAGRKKAEVNHTPEAISLLRLLSQQTERLSSQELLHAVLTHCGGGGGVTDTDLAVFVAAAADRESKYLFTYLIQLYIKTSKAAVGSFDRKLVFVAKLLKRHAKTLETPNSWH